MFWIGFFVGLGVFLLLSIAGYMHELKTYGISLIEDYQVDELIEVAGHNRGSVMQVVGPDGQILKSYTFENR